MIIVGLRGGLGNQLFQYCFGRQIAILNNQILKIDATSYTESRPDYFTGKRVYGLDNFIIKAELAKPGEFQLVEKYFKNSLTGKFYRSFNRFGDYRKKIFVQEPKKNYFVFDKNLLTTKFNSSTYFEGYWQSSKYFSSIKNQLIPELQFKDPATGKNLKMLNEIINSESVAIHVRHGDNARSAKHHGVLPLEYYIRSSNEILKKFHNSKFYIFSDDIEWCKQNLHIPSDMIFVDHNPQDKDFEDLRLMSKCRHHIIGNSTFSWWGAFLGERMGQIVYAPRYYHIGVDLIGTDFYPEGWRIV